MVATSWPSHCAGVYLGASLALGFASMRPAYAAEATYRAEAATVLPSTDTGWDYITL